MKDSVPNTKQGLITYINHCKEAIPRKEKEITRLHRLMAVAKNRLELFTKGG